MVTEIVAFFFFVAAVTGWGSRALKDNHAAFLRGRLDAVSNAYDRCLERAGAIYTDARMDVREAHRVRDRAIAQVQDLAQQLATIRVTYTEAAPDETAFATVEAREPYSEEIQAFLSGILSEDARILVEEHIESLREHGRADEQIFQIISLGDTV